MDPTSAPSVSATLKKELKKITPQNYIGITADY
jgi:hypothetical protein